MDNPSIFIVQIHNSEAYQIDLRLQTFRLNHYVFTKNYEEVKAILVIAESQGAFDELCTDENQQFMLSETLEITRTFHNFLASAKMLIDLTRSIIKGHYQTTQFYQEYKDKIEQQFTKNPLTRFIEGLRNYALHYQLPLTGTRFIDNEEDNSLQIVLITDQLRKWSNWEEKGKYYLDKAEDTISIMNLVDEYFTKINNFQKWMINRIEELHKDELSWLKEMELKIHNI